MREFTDQLGKKIVLQNIPQRVISIVPSQTELLFDVGLSDKIIGRTKFCIHPKPLIDKVQKVGGTKNLTIDLIQSLQPNLIIANKEENVKEQIEALEKICPVWISDITTIDEALQMMRSIGEIFEVQKNIAQLIETIENNFAQLQSFEKQKVIYLIWQEPMMTIGGDTFIHQLLSKAGLVNVFSHQNRYPEITDEQIIASDAALILLSSEPYPFTEKHKTAFENKFPNKKIVLVDGEMFSWYGSRMKLAANYFLQLRKNRIG